MDFNFNHLNNHVNSAATLARIVEEGEKIEARQKAEKAAVEKRRETTMKNIEENIKAQKINQDGMAAALMELVKIQNESNKIIEAQCEELKKQNALLHKQNEEQSKELKKQKIWNWITYGITTLIAIASVVGTFISIFR